MATKNHFAAPLPPEPPLVWSAALRHKFDAALVALGRLDSVSALPPNAALLLYSFGPPGLQQQR